MIRTTDDRLAAVCAGFVLLLATLWGRCAWLQVVSRGKLAAVADAQHWASRSLLAERGTVYDRTGRVLAMSACAPSVFANARLVVEKDKTATRLAKALGGDATFIKRRLSRDKGFVWVARQVDPPRGSAARQFRREGIGVLEEGKRMYPQGALAAHLLGFVDIDQHGLEGLELAYNGVLRGRAGWLSTLRDAKGDILIGPWTVEQPPQTGHSLVLTIDSVVQAAAEEALAWGVEKFHAKGGTVIVMEPSTGQLLAVANQPNFDPNHPGRVPVDARRLRAITDVFEPGSVFKVVTAAALLEEGLVQPEDRFYCEEGSWPTIGHHVLHDHKPHGWLTFHEVIQYSSNIGTAKAAQRLTPDQLYRYIRLFGFGRKTGVELRGEVNGLLQPPSRWSKLSPYLIPIGQEIATTPMQLAQMMAIVANGGWKIQPRVVRRIESADGRVVRDFDDAPRERLLREETIEHLQRMLVSVVESGTGQLANIQGLTVAGKTGTAQKLEPNGRYSHSRFVASFVGFGPVPDPRFVIVVSLDEPRPLYFGGVVSAPIFRRVVERLASYWELNRSAPSPIIAKSL